uniref:Glycine N-acyltransferase-like protein n=1 Tax=Myripristis murdjan TaxID=586833 RepID=A0A667WWK5_9TELE
CSIVLQKWQAACYFSVFCFPAALSSVLQVLGGVLHILHNNCCHLEMCVDSWPTFSAAICYSQKQVISDICAVFTKSPETLKRLLLNERVVNWRNGLRFRGCVLKKIIKNVHSAFNRFIYITPPHIKLPVSTLTRKLLPLPISILHESHAELVDRHLPYGGSQENLEHVRACIRHLPNLCVTDDKGQPVSWILSDELCELRMAYTLPEYRRAGHLTALSQALIRRMILLKNWYCYNCSPHSIIFLQLYNTQGMQCKKQLSPPLTAYWK